MTPRGYVIVAAAAGVVMTCRVQTAWAWVQTGPHAIAAHNAEGRSLMIERRNGDLKLTLRTSGWGKKGPLQIWTPAIIASPDHANAGQMASPMFGDRVFEIETSSRLGASVTTVTIFRT